MDNEFDKYINELTLAEYHLNEACGVLLSKPFKTPQLEIATANLHNAVKDLKAVTLRSMIKVLDTLP